MFELRCSVDNLNIIGRIVFYLCFFILVMLSAKVCFELINYREWGDESETIVAAKMMAAGKSLYSEIFNHHGPLTFLPAYLLEKMGSFGVQGHRTIIVSFQVILFLAVIFYGKKPLLLKCLYSSFLIVALWGYGPKILANVYQYQTLTGISLFSILYFLTLPTLTNITISRMSIVFNGMLIFCLPLISITNVPVAFLILLATITKHNRRDLFSGLLLGLLISSIYMVITTSFKGYVAYHLYLNSQILPIYNGGQSVTQLVEKALSGISSSPVNIIIFSICAIGLFKTNKLGVYRTILILAGLCSLLIRSEPLSFHGVPYLYSFLAILSSFKLFSNQRCISNFSVLETFLVILLVIKMSSIIYRGDYSTNKLPESSSFANIAHQLTGKNDKILVHSFANYLYILADRLPASAHYFYLPWQEKYEEYPVLGISNNICDDINKNQPKLVYLDKWKVWDRYDWSSYAPKCFQKIMENKYRRLGKVYIINELFYDLFKVVDIINVDNNLIVNYVNNVDILNNIIYFGENDPFVSYEVAYYFHKLSSGKLYLDINFYDLNDHEIKIYVAYSGGSYSESNSVVLELSTNKYSIDLQKLIGFPDDAVIDQVRLDFESPLKKVTINKIAYD